MKLTATELRSQLYKVLDTIAETGEPVEIVRKGKTLKISVEREAPQTFRVEHLVARPGTIRGQPDALIHLDWSKEWKPFEGES